MKTIKTLLVALLAMPLFTACSDRFDQADEVKVPVTIHELMANSWIAPFGNGGLKQIFAFADLTVGPTVSAVNIQPLDEFDDEDGEEEEPVVLPDLEDGYLTMDNADGFFEYQIVDTDGTLLFDGLGYYQLDPTSSEAPVILQMDPEDTWTYGEPVDEEWGDDEPLSVKEEAEPDPEKEAAEKARIEKAQAAAAKAFELFEQTDAQKIYWVVSAGAGNMIKIMPFGTFTKK